MTKKYIFYKDMENIGVMALHHIDFLSSMQNANS